jgi:hypothetical protein
VSDNRTIIDKSRVPTRVQRTKRAKPDPKPPIDIITACTDPDIFGPWFRDMATWAAWFVVLKVMFGLPLSDDELAIFRKHTGRTTPAAEGYLSTTLVIGRRGGKSVAMALIAAYLAAFFDWRPFLTLGESGTIIIVAADKKQAAVTLGYLREMLSIPLLKGMITRETAEVIELNSGVVIEVVTANFKTIRGRTVCCAIADELAFWETDEGGASPDSAILAALRPAMATVPGARLLKASSPYARRGVLWNDYKKHFGRDDSKTLVWQASTEDMNPAVPADFIRDAYEDDPVSAEAELGANFRTDVESYINRDVVDACVVKGRFELPPLQSGKFLYTAFVDAAGGSGGDSMCLAIAHAEGERVVIDCVRERVPPFSPEDVVQEFAQLLRAYNIRKVMGDRWAGAWPSERFEVHKIGYEVAPKPKSNVYRDFLPLVNGQRVELLDHPKAIAQLCSLERRVARGGKDSIDHPPGSSHHDDVINVIAGVATNLIITDWSGGRAWLEIARQEMAKAKSERPEGYSPFLPWPPDTEKPERVKKTWAKGSVEYERQQRGESQVDPAQDSRPISIRQPSTWDEWHDKLFAPRP